MNKHSVLSSVLSDVNTANGLPNEHYIDPVVFAEEKRSVLFANWSGIGFGKDVPEVGDARPIDFLGMPLLVVRDRDGEIGVFQNTCRHRGMILVDEPKKISGAIRCPYHSWCYDLKGKLRATPHVGGPGQNKHDDVDPNDLGLIRVRSYVWRDVIFVNIDGQAPEFEQAASQLAPNVRLAKVNIEQAQQLSARFNIRSIPSLVLFHRGREVSRMAGATNAAGIVNWTRQQLS